MEAGRKLQDFIFLTSLLERRKKEGKKREKRICTTKEKNTMIVHERDAEYWLSEFSAVQLPRLLRENMQKRQAPGKGVRVGERF